MHTGLKATREVIKNAIDSEIMSKMYATKKEEGKKNNTTHPNEVRSEFLFNMSLRTDVCPNIIRYFILSHE